MFRRSTLTVSKLKSFNTKKHQSTPAADSKITFNDPEKHFKAVTYTGDGATNRAITGLKFKPDLVWIKCRSVNANHGMINSVCEDGSGNKTMLYPNLNNSETVGGNFCILFTATGQQPFIDNGFRINNTATWAGMNATGGVYFYIAQLAS